ncbi:MAG: GNAT family N-acetyltransferase [Candidatus Hodarchaeota archaeon]
MIIEQNKYEKEFLSRIVQSQSLSVISYILWYHHYERESIDFSYSLDPFSYIYRYENKYYLFGENFWELAKNIRWFKDNIILIFQNKNIWNEIVEKFDNFRSLETNKPAQTFNTYLTLYLTQDAFSCINSNKELILKIPSEKYPILKRYRHLKNGLNFGLIKNNKIVSFASAPHIMTGYTTSFAVLRGVETNMLERGQGYAQVTVSKLCKELFTKFEVKYIFLWVEENNFAGIKIYNNLGFKEAVKIYTSYCDLKSKFT